MLQRSKTIAFLGAALLALGLSVPLAAAEKKFIDSDDGKKDDDAPQTFLKDYDKLVKGKEADWVYFTGGFDAKAYKTVRIKEFSTSGKGSRLRNAAEDGAGFYERWIQRAKLGWEVAPKGADLTLEGNIANAWEPSGGAKFWGGWMANPGTCQEVIGRNSGGKIVFQIRQKSRGSTVSDAVENGIEKIVETLKQGK
jgi:hypothetical protein